jgi:excinuclease ABC subunit C
MSYKKFPDLSGVYLFKDKDDAILYIGKAKSLKKRVASYFQNQDKDWKIGALIEDHATVEYIITPTEIEASLLEAELIKKYQPKYNVLLKSGQPFIYILFTQQAVAQDTVTELDSEQVSTRQSSEQKDIPPARPECIAVHRRRRAGKRIERVREKKISEAIKIVRNKKEKGTYFGPFLYKQQARSVYQFLVQTFKLNLCNKKIENGCLDYHIGTCPGSCLPNFNEQDYLFRVQLARNVLQEQDKKFVAMIKEKIAEYSNNKEFEKAQALKQYLDNVQAIFSTIKARYDSKKYATDIAAATSSTSYVTSMHAAGTAELQDILNLKHAVHKIDCFDISHFQSKEIVGSCVRFTDGKPDKNSFRRFIIKSLDRQNDYAALQEIIARRYEHGDIPDLIVIDGGKGQLSAAKQILAHIAPNTLCVSLAKREELLFSSVHPDGYALDVKTNHGALLIALRDYTHHFAISYHRLRRKKELAG